MRFPLLAATNPVSFAALRRALSSAVEHHLDMVGVSGSIPLARTIPDAGAREPAFGTMSAMPVITLPDGSQKNFDRPVTVAEVAASIDHQPSPGGAGLVIDGYCCDRVAIMYDGRIVRELEGGDITETNIVASSLNIDASEAAHA